MEEITRYRIGIAARGILELFFGIIAFTLPIITVAALVLFFGVFVLFSGAILTWEGIKSFRKQRFSGLTLFQGVVGIVAGLLTLLMPGIAALTLLILIASWAVVSGAFEIAAALHLRHVINNEWLLGLSGFASILLGILLIAMPGAGLVVWSWMLGAYAITSAILHLILAFQPNSPRERRGRRAFAS